MSRFETPAEEADLYEYRLVYREDALGGDDRFSIGAVKGPEEHAVGVWSYRTDPNNAEVYYGDDVVLQRRLKQPWENFKGV